jgi:hypothetical protein
VLAEDRLVRHRKSGSYALFSDLFRYRIRELELGYWMDCDAYIRRPLQLDRDHVFAWEHGGSLGCGILYMETRSPLLKALLRFVSASNLVPPWWPVHVRCQAHLAGVLGRRSTMETLKWGIIGPAAVTHFARRYGLLDQALPSKAFYPLRNQDAVYLFDPKFDIASLIAGDTLSVHFWNTEIKSLKKWPAPPGSFIHTLCLRHDIDPRAVA